MTAKHLWSDIRALRARRPGLATSSVDRKKVFSSSLQQSEELWNAANKATLATRPLDLFYSLSQAGRALAASWETDPEAWELRGHGIKAPPASGIGFEARTVVNGFSPTAARTRWGSFGNVASMLSSPTLPIATPLVDLWASLPNVGRASPSQAATPLEVQWIEGEASRILSPSGHFVFFLGPDLARLSTPSSPLELVEEWKSVYPQLASLNIVEEPRVETLMMQGQRILLAVDVPRGSASSSVSQFKADLAYRFYEGDLIGNRWWVLPSVAGNPAPLHPLVTWWALLYGLSSLSRYEPGLWADAINVDESPLALPLAILLEDALEQVPELVLRELRR